MQKWRERAGILSSAPSPTLDLTGSLSISGNLMTSPHEYSAWKLSMGFVWGGKTK